MQAVEGNRPTLVMKVVEEWDEHIEGYLRITRGLDYQENLSIQIEGSLLPIYCFTGVLKLINY